MFYLTLPSNSSMSYFPDNTLAHYRIKLPQVVSLEGEWEVGLAEIQYPLTWYNISGDQRHVTVKRKRSQDRNFVLQRLSLTEGYYPDVKTVVEKLNDLMPSVDGPRPKPSFALDALSQKVNVEINNVYRIKLGEDLHRMLGFDDNERLLSSENCRGQHVADLAQGFHNLYVYANIVEPRVVGDSLVPLLRIVPVQGQHGEVTSVAYNPIHYVPLQIRQFQILEVYIRDDAGQPVPFERGKVVVTLHLRRRPLLAQQR